MIRQRNPRSPRVLSVRPMVEADLEYLRQPSRRQGLVRPLRDAHHNVCRLMALGLSNQEIADRLGYSYNRISMFRSDPACIERVALLRQQIDDRVIDEGQEYLLEITRNARMAERQLGERLELVDDTGEYLPIRDYIAITSDRMDRLGPSKKSLNVNLNVGMAERMEKVIAQKRERDSKKVAAE